MARGLHAEVEDRDDMWMLQTKHTSLIEECMQLFGGEACMQNLYGNLRLAMDILAKVDLTESPFSEQANQAVVIKLLSLTSAVVGHTQSPFGTTGANSSRRCTKSEIDCALSI